MKRVLGGIVALVLLTACGSSKGNFFTMVDSDDTLNAEEYGFVKSDEKIIGKAKCSEIMDVECNSYQDAYNAVIDNLENYGPGNYKYDLIYFDEDNIPELVVGSGGGIEIYMYNSRDNTEPIFDGIIGAHGLGYKYLPQKSRIYDEADESEYCYDHSKGSSSKYTADKNNPDLGESEHLSAKLSVSEIRKQLGCGEYKVAAIEGDDDSFCINDKSYRIASEQHGNMRIFSVSDGIDTVETGLYCDKYKMFVFFGDNKRAFLYLNVSFEGENKLYIYDLNREVLKEPLLYGEGYALYNGTITNPYQFFLQRRENELCETGVQRKFSISECGLPVPLDETVYYIGKSALVDGSIIPEHGETLIAKKSFTADPDGYLDNVYIYGPNDETTFEAGDRFVLYKYKQIMEAEKNVCHY